MIFSLLLALFSIFLGLSTKQLTMTFNLDAHRHPDVALRTIRKEPRTMADASWPQVRAGLDPWWDHNRNRRLLCHVSAYACLL